MVVQGSRRTYKCYLPEKSKTSGGLKNIFKTLWYLFFDMFHQSATLNKRLHKGRNRPGLIGNVCLNMQDFAGIKINGEYVARIKGVGLITFQNWKSHVKGISVKYPGKTLGNYT